MNSQVMDTGHRVDTLSTLERLSLRTSAVDWLLLLPNIGVEYDVRNTNWNRWSVGMNLRYNWQSSHTYKSGLVYNIFEARLEVRNYYRIRLFDGKFIEKKKHIWERVVSPRRAESKHPTTTYYRGAFLAYDNYSLKLSAEGKQGNAIIGGVMWGMIKPLYEFNNGNTLDLEFAASAGVAYAKYDTYTHDRLDDCYPITDRQKTTVMPVINELRVGFVYRFGSYPITKKYRWRYDVDIPYQERMDSVIRETRNRQEAQHLSDSIYQAISKVFWERYEQLAKKNKAKDEAQQAEQKNNAAKNASNKKAAAEKKAADKAAAKADESAAKAEKKAKKKQSKNQGTDKPVALESTDAGTITAENPMETPFDALESTIEETSAESSEKTTVPIEETNEEEKKE